MGSEVVGLAALRGEQYLIFMGCNLRSIRQIFFLQQTVIFDVPVIYLHQLASATESRKKEVVSIEETAPNRILKT